MRETRRNLSKHPPPRGNTLVQVEPGRNVPLTEEELAGGAVGAEFIVTLAQELRAPLSALRVSFDLLKDPNAIRNRPGELRRLLDNMERSIARLERQMTDLLEVGYLRSGTLPLRREVVSPNGVLAAAIDHLRPQAAQRNVAIELIVEEALPAVNVDPARLEQVLVHLLSNAIKFTAVDGLVMVRAWVRPVNAGAPSHGPGAAVGMTQVTDGKAARELVVTVSDQGPGIPEEFHEKVFRPFYRLKGGQGESSAGVGLGLAIAKGLVELHGGRIWLESKRGAGAVFGFSIPLGLER